MVLFSDLQDIYGPNSAHTSCFNHRTTMWSMHRNISIESFYTLPCSCSHLLNRSQLRVNTFPSFFSWKRYFKAVSLNFFKKLFLFFNLKTWKCFPGKMGIRQKHVKTAFHRTFCRVLLSSPSRLSQATDWKTLLWRWFPNDNIKQLNRNPSVLY